MRFARSCLLLMYCLSNAAWRCLLACVSILLRRKVRRARNGGSPRPCTTTADNSGGDPSHRARWSLYSSWVLPANILSDSRLTMSCRATRSGLQAKELYNAVLPLSAVMTCGKNPAMSGPGGVVR